MNDNYSCYRNDKSFMIGAFRSRQQVMKFMKDINANNADARIINTPHEIKIGCGLSAAFSEKHYELAKQIIRQTKPPSFVGFYKGTPDGVRLKVEPAMNFIM